MTSVFADLERKVYPYRYHGVLHVNVLAGGVPSDDKVAEGWLRTKLADKDDLIRDEVARTMLERGIGVEEAMGEVAILKHLNGFKRDELGLYIEGRQLKAAVKEAATIRWPGRRWGDTRKGTKAFWAEHVFILENTLHVMRDVDGTLVHVTEPSGVAQRFVHTWRGNGIQYEEYVEAAIIEFTAVTDHKFDPDEWAHLWLTGEKNGLGASRSQGFGTYEVVTWGKAAS